MAAKPGGKLFNYENKQEYSYLFWEGKSYDDVFNDLDISQGFVVSGENTQSFLQKTFSAIGLLPHEYNELLVYWLPKMIGNKFNYIHFLIGKDYDPIAGIKIDPEPDAMLRVFIVFQPLSYEKKVTPQLLSHFERKGFSVVEWEGTQTENLSPEF